MDTIIHAINGAFQMIISGDPQILEITALSMKVSLTALFISALVGIPLGALLGLKRFPGKNLVMNLAYTLMALPPVLAGLIVYLTVSNAGPLGMLEMLYTPDSHDCRPDSARHPYRMRIDRPGGNEPAAGGI